MTDPLSNILTPTQQETVDSVSSTKTRSQASMKMPTAPQQGSANQTQMGERPLGVNIHTRPMGAHSQRDCAVTMHDYAIVNEAGWDLTKAVEKPQVIGSYAWNTTQASRVFLAEYTLPFDLLTSSAFLSMPFDNFLLWRGEIELHLQTNGTPFHQGTVVMFYVPVGDVSKAPFSLARSSLTNITSLQHVFLHANSATSACMTIPFINPATYLNLSDVDQNVQNMGSVGICVFNPLQVASGAATTIDVSVVAQFKNSQFKVPRPRAAQIAPPSFEGEGILADFLGETPGTLVQRMLPANIISDVIDTTLGFFGLDKPTSIERGAPMKMLGTQYLNSTVEIDYLDKFTLFPDKLQETSRSTFAVDCDETSIDFLKKKYTYLGTFSQSITDAPGKVLGMTPLNPCPRAILGGGESDSEVPLLQYISMPFNFWKGGLTYKLQVVASSFHVTKIFVAIQYGLLETPITNGTLVNFSSQYGYAFEVNQGSTEFEFTVPYVASTAQLAVPNGKVCTNQNSMGTIYIVVMNQLANPNNTVNSINYNMFIAGADDFCLSTMSGSNSTVMPQYVGQSLLTTPFSNTETAKDVNVISPAPVKARYDACETSVHSFNQVMKKYSQVYTGTFTLSRNPTAIDQTIISLSRFLRPSFPSSPPPLGFVKHSSFPEYVAALYGGFRGPTRLKVILHTALTQQAFRVSYLPPFYSTSTQPLTDGFAYLEGNITVSDTSVPVPFSDLVRPRTHTSICNSVQKSIEIEIPFNSIFNFTHLRHIYDNNLDLSTVDLGSLQINFFKDALNKEAEDTTQIVYDIFYAFGDESRFGIFTGVPPVRLIDKTSAPTLPIWPDNWMTASTTSTINPL